jgi:hypothetical protein
VQDRRLAEDGWQQTGFDDSAWSASDYVKPGLTNTPWYHFAPDPLPARPIEPVPVPAALHTAEVALPVPRIEELGAARPAAPGGISASLPLRVEGGAAAKVVTLDLGRVECGFLALEVSGPAGAISPRPELPSPPQRDTLPAERC